MLCIIMTERNICVLAQTTTARSEIIPVQKTTVSGAGHFQHHYKIMPGIELRPVEIVSSPMDSGGRNPCVIRYVRED